VRADVPRELLVRRRLFDHVGHHPVLDRRGQRVAPLGRVLLRCWFFLVWRTR
jgi:hypothetical protein